jgi:diguanylate cyclase (GGDEF)-like protein
MCVDYSRRYGTDRVQRKIFISAIIMTLLAISCDFTHQLLVEQPGQTARILLYLVNTLYYFSQVGSMYITIILFDYISYKEIKRLKIMVRITAVITLIHIATLSLNLKWGFYFFFTEDNAFVYGDKYFIRLLISYLPFILSIIDVLLSYKRISAYQINIIFIIFILFSAGSTLGFVSNNSVLFWICSTACFLSLYLFIMRNEARFDILTGIGNRQMFYECIDKLNKQRCQQSWSIAILDIDNFRSINNTYGHIEGDNALREAAATIKGCIRSSDVVVRYGNDEFLLAVQSEYDLDKLMARIQQSLYDRNEKNTRPYTLTMSYGYGSFVTHSKQNINELLVHIESIMCKQKNAKRRAGDKK